MAKAEMLSQENVQLQATIEGLEKERDFYFEKLVRMSSFVVDRTMTVLLLPSPCARDVGC